MSYNYYIYILASSKNGVLYIGMTNELARRVLEHKKCLNNSFTSKYKVFNLVYYEIYEDVNEAITREKNMKKWKRDWKVELIERDNPDWNDLYNEIIEE